MALITSMSAFGHDMLIEEIRNVISNDKDSVALTKTELKEAKGNNCEYYDVGEDNSADGSGFITVSTKTDKKIDLPELNLSTEKATIGKKVEGIFKRTPGTGKYHSFRYYMNDEKIEGLNEQEKETWEVKDQYFAQINTDARILSGKGNQIIVVRKVNAEAAGTLSAGYYMEISESTKSIGSNDLKSVFSDRYERVSSLTEKEAPADYLNYKAIRYIVCKLDAK